MNDYIFLMHNDARDNGLSRDDNWAEYITKLQQAGVFQGGSAIGDGICLSKSGTPPAVTQQLSGFILSRAKELVHGNPVFEAGGTVEIRELPKT